MCGLFGYISKDKEWNELSKFKFELLGVMMDDRGGDGCGIAYDGIVDKGTVPKKFDDFWRTERVPPTLYHNAIIGHDRKASVGAQTFENTQPISFENLNTILAHNGTIYNFEEMYKAHRVKDHFDYNIVGMSDSQVMGLLMEKSGWQVLNEYVGTMAFLCMRIDEPGVIYAYHGRSALRVTTAPVAEERPLYYAMENGETWFCSTRPALERIIRDKASVAELPFNTVFRFDGDTMTSVYEANRSRSTQFEPWSNTQIEPWSNTQNWNHSSQSNIEYENEEWYKQAFPETTKKLPAWNNKDILNDEYPCPLKDSIYYEAGFYKANSKLLNGIIRCAPSGKIISADDPSYKYTYTFCFYEGNMVRSAADYIELLKTVHTSKFKSSIPMMKLWMLGKFFANPFIVKMSGENGKTFVYSTTPNEAGLSCNLFSGVIIVPFCSKEIRVKNGTMDGINLGEYASIACIMKWAVDEKFTITEEDMDKITASCYDDCQCEADKNPSYECPICLNWGELLNPGGDNIICPACGGATTITRNDLLEYIKERLEDATPTLIAIKSEHDVTKVISLINWVSDIGLAILQKNQSLECSELEDIIHEIKLMLWSK